MKNKIKVLIVDDHLIFRMGVKGLLMKEPDICVVGEARDYREALDKFASLGPDLCLVDLRLPGRSGIDVLDDIRKSNKNAKVIIVSSFGNEEEVYRAMNAGAFGYLLKDIGRDEFLEAIHEVAADRKYISPALRPLLSTRASRPNLSPREHEVLLLLVRGLTNREIASILQKSEHTIRNQTISIFEKLEVTDRAEAVSVALQRGIVIPPE